MLNMIQADIFKMAKSPIIKILFGITTLCAVIMILMAYSITKGQLDPNLTGLCFMFSDVNMISILGAVIAGTFICGDFDNKTIHNAIAGGCNRLTVIISKAIVFFFGCLFLLLPYAIITIITLNMGLELNIGSVAVGFLNLITNSKTYTTSDVFKLVLIILTILLVYISQLSICIPLSLIIRKPVLVVAVYYGVTILCAQLSNIKGNSAFETIFSFTPYGGKYSLLTLESGINEMVKAALISLTFILIILALTYSLFRKSEI